MLNHRRLLVSMMVGVVSWVPGSANAQIYSSMYFSQLVSADAFLQNPKQTVVSTTVPIEQTASVSTTYGGNVQAIYGVTDNGSVATLDITAFGSVTPSDGGVGEEGYDQGGGKTTAFSFTVPVRYSVFLSESGAGSLDFTLSGGTLVSSGFSDSSRSYSGQILANDTVYLGESWGIDNASGTPTSQSGGDSIQMTFTPVNPIPEPSSIGLLAVIAAVLMARRRPRSLQKPRLQH